VPRRSAAGLDSGRLALVLAVLEQRGAVPIARSDVYASIAGGLRVTETGLDLALALALAGARLGLALPEGVVAVGEVGLGGEIRSVPQLERRLVEAARLGFTFALVPEGVASSSPVFEDARELRVIGVRDVREAVEVGLGLVEPPAVDDGVCDILG